VPARTQSSVPEPGSTSADTAEDGIVQTAESVPGTATEAVGGRKFEFVLLDNSSAKIQYSRSGLRISSQSGNYTARVRGRIQLRYYTPFDSDPHKESDFLLVGDDLHINRARFKLDGNLFGKKLTYNYEHDLVATRVLNLFASFEAKEWLQFRGGQMKVAYSRERVTSSSKQQFVERSIVNRDFTVDRQIGFEIFGHLMPGTRGDSWYSAGVYTGTGRGNGFESGGHPMFAGRYQWNFLGQDLDYSSSDVEEYDTPAASLAIAGATNRSRYTRFSSSGGGQLDGFESGLPGQYSLKQLMGEVLVKYRGFSAQNENHWKRVSDNVNDASTDILGSYVQAGYLFSRLIPDFPRQAEVAYRYGIVDDYSGVPGNQLREHTVALNLFLEGHNNKITFDVGRLSLDRQGMARLSKVRYRVQWDIHF